MRKLWTEAEDDVLRDVARRGVPLIDEMHRLPGRTHAGARQHAWNYLKLRLGRHAWTEEEHAVLRQIYASDESVKRGVARLLPSRTYNQAKQESAKIGLANQGVQRTYGYSSIFYRIERALADGRAASVKQLAGELGVSISAVGRALNKQRGTRARVGDYGRLSNGGLEDLWMLGAGPDAPRPPRKTSSEACRTKRARAKVRAGRFDPFSTLRQQIAA
ncbi:hypothetical protein [Paraburkholderia acidiphila]|uniref:Uncharacterized protein n=1 Tax=Paraburkholderia acidiphila TaxID=2571747 RepID=A0A7Z2JBC7_9BURK|nr:hypothetical protein [Paraburkholderia acidiphila]QGZ56735.1 hypothetical protein FAZ97_17375 [Paraburkholderia acidiphila]